MKNLKYIIGIDGGGTKTLGYISNDKGEIIYKYVVGASNYLSVGETNTKLVLKSLLENLCDKVGICLDEIAVLSLGMAGLARDNDKSVMKNILLSIGYKNEIIMNSDAFTSLVGALGNKRGIVTICGTGSISMGIDEEGSIVRAGGWGHIISDEGSGYHIGMSCLKAIMKSYDNLEQFTLLSEEVLSFLKLKSETDIINYLYNEERQKKDIASIAPIVFKIAEIGDKVANKIVDEAVGSLIDITKKVIDKVYKDDAKITVAVDGGILKNVEIIRGRFSRQLVSDYKDIQIINPVYDGGIGALIIGTWKLNKDIEIADIKYLMRGKK